MDGNTERWIKDYSYYLRIERKMSPNTVASYVGDVSAFLDTLPPGTAAVEAGPAELSEYFVALSSRLSERSQARTLSSLRSFFDFLILEGERQDNPCDSVEAPKIGRYLPEVLSEQEVSDIMDSVDLRTWTGLRDRAILEVLYGCGLRVSEAVGLRISDIWFDEAFVRVVGKGDKERIVPICGSALDAVNAYLPARVEPAEPRFSDILFLNRFGKQLSRVSVFNMIRRQALSAGVTKEISPHTMRHSFATHLIENGADLRAVQEMLGHENILTTEIYTHIGTSTWQKSVLDHHPSSIR